MKHGVTRRRGHWGSPAQWPRCPHSWQVDFDFLAANLSFICLAELGFCHFLLPFPENETASSLLLSLLPFILSRAARMVTNVSGTEDSSIAAFSNYEDSSWVKTLERSLGKSSIPADNASSSFRTKLWRSAEFTSVSSSTLSVSAHSWPSARALR